MKITKIELTLSKYLPWCIIAICIMKSLFAWLLGHQNEAFAWIIATVGWIAYKIEV